MLRGDLYVGRGSRQRGLSCSEFANDFKVSVHGRDVAIAKFTQKLAESDDLKSRLRSLSGRRLVCHCRQGQACHGDAIVSAFRERFPEAFDRNASDTRPPTAEHLRTEPEEEELSSPDEGAQPRNSGWRGNGPALMVGSGYTARELCDGMSLASPGRWSPNKRNFPNSPAWKAVASLVLNFTREHGTTDLLMALALGKAKTCPFPHELITRLKEQTVETLGAHGLTLDRHPDDRRDVPIDFRYLGLLLRAAEDPDVHIGDFARGVRVSPVARLPRHPALYSKKTRWRLPEQYDPLDYQEERSATEGVWSRNYPTLEETRSSTSWKIKPKEARS